MSPVPDASWGSRASFTTPRTEQNSLSSSPQPASPRSVQPAPCSRGISSAEKPFRRSLRNSFTTTAMAGWKDPDERPRLVPQEGGAGSVLPFPACALPAAWWRQRSCGRVAAVTEPKATPPRAEPPPSADAARTDRKLSASGLCLPREQLHPHLPGYSRSGMVPILKITYFGHRYGIQ